MIEYLHEATSGCKRLDGNITGFWRWFRPSPGLPLFLKLKFAAGTVMFDVQSIWERI